MPRPSRAWSNPGVRFNQGGVGGHVSVLGEWAGGPEQRWFSGPAVLVAGLTLAGFFGVTELWERDRWLLGPTGYWIVD
jgi:hypothetical protein